MSELTAGMLIETALQVQMTRVTDGKTVAVGEAGCMVVETPPLAECVREANEAWWLAMQLASGQDEGPGLFEVTAVGEVRQGDTVYVRGRDGEMRSVGVATCPAADDGTPVTVSIGAPNAEMVREEAALRQIMRTWAAETLVPLQHALLDVGDVVLDFRGMLSERCVQVAPGLVAGEMLVQEICGEFADAQVIESPRGQCFRNLWRKAVPA